MARHTIFHEVEDLVDLLDARDVKHGESFGGIEVAEQSGPLANDCSEKLVVWVIGVEGAVVL